MAKKTRANVFETNSSSAHSLVIYKTNNGAKRLTPEECRDGLYWDYDEDTGIYTIDDDCYFGRYPFKILRKFEDKVKYAYANCPYRRRGTDDKYYPDYNKVNRVMRELVPGFKKMVRARNVYLGVDEACLWKWLKDAKVSLKDFLTDPAIIVICDGDEYNNWSHLKRIGLINTDNILFEGKMTGD